MFCTVLRGLKSPENTGLIVRSHVAFGGDRVVVVGEKEPWSFQKQARAFSRRLNGVCEVVFLPTDDALFSWCREQDFTPVALEIRTPPTLLNAFAFPPRTALIVGHERQGLPPEFLGRCASVVSVPQHGPVACLNVAVAAAVAMYECVRGRPGARAIAGAKYECGTVGTENVDKNHL